jgi:mRNA interferase MazF
MKSGDIVLASLPQADGKTKLRPALVLKQMLPYKDLLVCGISTQINQEVLVA